MKLSKGFDQLKKFKVHNRHATTFSFNSLYPVPEIIVGLEEFVCVWIYWCKFGAIIRVGLEKLKFHNPVWCKPQSVSIFCM